MATTPHTILIVSGYGGIRPPEPIANEVMKPGHLLRGAGKHFQNTESAEKVALAVSAGGPIQPLFALEADYVATRDEALARIDHPYASGDRVHCMIMERGARVYAFLASGQNVAMDQLLTSAGGGELRAASGSTGIALAKEAVNASSGTSRIIVEVL
jgi:TPP-dependent indolepyruvate ferredoxin oxidoreductase alpha subunit